MSEYAPVAVKLIQLRFLVGALGERLDWWPSHFTEPVGLRLLTHTLPRSALRAALESVTVAARRNHDRQLSPNSVHLFRLGSAPEDSIGLYLAQGIELTAPPTTAEEILAALDELGPPDGSHAPVGPCSLGKIQRTRRHDAVADMARIYAAAARARQPAIPYFEVTG